MADNTTLNAASGGDVISTDDIGGVKVQRVKVQFGVDGSATDVSSAAPLPVSVSALPSGASTAANQATELALLASIDGKTPALSGGAVPVVAASLPLPTLAATSTKQSDGSQITQIAGSAAQAAAGIVAGISAQGQLQVVAAITNLLTDPFDGALDTTNRWTTSGTSAPTTSAGDCVLDLTAANSVSSVLVSQPSFVAAAQFFQHGAKITVGSQQTNPNVHRFWGRGSVASYAASTPLDNGVGVEVDLTGALNLVCYISGVRYVINSTNPALITGPGGWAAGMAIISNSATMTWPADGRFVVVVQESSGFASFSSSVSGGAPGVPLGIIIYAPVVSNFPIRAAAISTPAVSTVLATTFRVTDEKFGVINGSNNTVSDPTYGWRQQSVDAQARAYSVSPDVFTTGVAAQTASGNNILLTAAGTSSIDTQAVGARSISIQIVPTGTVSSGVVSFEGSHDNVTFVALPLYDTASLTANPVTSVASLATNRYFVGNTVYRYIRARISTVIGGGGSIQAFYTLSQFPFVPSQQTVVQATAANHNVTATIASGTVTTVSTVTAVSASTPVTPTTTFTNSAATTNATSTKASAGTLWSVNVSNINAAVRYLKFYNKASAPTVGTDVPVMVIPIPIGGNVQIDGGSNGIRFSTGIAWALTTGSADSDTGAVAASEHKVVISYT